MRNIELIHFWFDLRTSESLIHKLECTIAICAPIDVWELLIKGNTLGNTSDAIK
jgi:hypothetical protein